MITIKKKIKKTTVSIVIIILFLFGLNSFNNESIPAYNTVFPWASLSYCYSFECVSQWISGCCAAMLKTNSSICGDCSPRAVFSILQDSVGHFRLSNPQGSPCRNLHPLPDLKQCGGQCGSQSRFRDLIGGFQSTCSCCQPTSVSQRHVTLTCEDGTSLEHSYTVAEACQCGACSEGQWRHFGPF